MVSNLNTSVNNQQFINQAQTPGMQNWMMGGTSNQSQASPSISNVTNTINLFGNMNITQPVNQSTSSSQATASFSLFDGMTYPSSSQAIPKATIQAKSTQEKSGLLDDFGDFQDSAVQKPVDPLKDDSWSAGRHLFDLSNLK